MLMTCQARIAELLSEVDLLKITGRQMRKSRKGRDKPKKDKTRLKVTRYTCFMSEVQLQGLLDRTKPSKGDEEAMGMTKIDGVRVSKYSITPIKIGKNVSAQMREEFEQFNAEHVCRRRQRLPNQKWCSKNIRTIQRQALHA